MTSIKPPGSGGPPVIRGPGTTRVDEHSVDRASSTSESFRSTLERTGSPAANTTGGVSSVDTKIPEWASDLRAGNITRSEAIDRLVAEEVTKRQREGVTSTGLDALARTIRIALESDPVIGRMLDDVIRARG